MYSSQYLKYYFSFTLYYKYTARFGGFFIALIMNYQMNAVSLAYHVGGCESIRLFLFY